MNGKRTFIECNGGLFCMPVDGRQGYLSPMAGVLGELKTDVVRCDIVQDLPDVDDRVSLSSSLNGLEAKVLQALVIVHISTTKDLVSEVTTTKHTHRGGGQMNDPKMHVFRITPL